MAIKLVLLVCFLSVAVAEPQQNTRIGSSNAFDVENELQKFSLRNNRRETTTPIPILQSIDTHNSDGSYTYGYEGGDGAYKIETRYATGEVKGKYGYYDDTGLLREVEYGAEPDPNNPIPIYDNPDYKDYNDYNPTPVTEAPLSVIERPQKKFENFQPFPVPSSRPSQPIRKTVVRRPRPQPAVPQQPTFQPLPRSQPAVHQQPAFQLRPRSQPAVPQQPRFQAQQRFAPVAPQQPSGPLPSSVSFFNHPYISDFNFGNGVFSYSY